MAKVTYGARLSATTKMQCSVTNEQAALAELSEQNNDWMTGQ
jgi:hypothetical protein